MQRRQLIGIAAGTFGLMALLWYVGVTTKQKELSRTKTDTAQMQDKLKEAENVMRKDEDVFEQLQTRQQLLDRREMILTPDRDAYAWIISTMTPFVQTHKGINIFHYSQPEVMDSGLIPRFPYKWAIFRLDGTGYFHDWGKFFADLETGFPSFRVQNLSMSANASVGNEAEKLGVTFELVVPVKPSDTK